tara:strand:- start:2941 stop:4035 length:1095 start_codon:yes stop_codon:yes gene_type:complete
MSEPTIYESSSVPPEQVSISRRAPRWAVVIAVIFAVGFLTVVALDRVIITSKVLTSPGATRQIGPMLQVDPAKTFEAEGQIEMVTVKSNLQPSVLELLGGWLDDSIKISPRHEILGDRTVEQNRTLGQEQMARSLDIAARVALERIGYDVISEAGALVIQIVPDTPAFRTLDRGDVIIQAENREVKTSRDLGELVRNKSPGDKFSFSVLQIDGTIREETVKLSERDGNAFLGVSISTYVEMDELPFDIDFQVERVGGPSAGLSLTLALLERMLPGELLGGLEVVATGTVDPLGNVGAVGGIEQKSHTVMRNGADIFFVPAMQADQARDVLGNMIEVIGVETLDDALSKLRSLGGDLAGVELLAQ